MKFYDEAPIDFAAVVRQLRNNGVTRAEIAVYVNVVPRAVDRWLAGAEPSFHNGRALLTLWSLRTGRAPDEVFAPLRVPTVTRPAAP